MIKLAVIGAGRMGGLHAKNILKGRVKGGKLAAICDIAPEVLKKYSQYPDVKTYQSVDELLSAHVVDAVIIATPHYAHPDIAVKCLKAGLHILVEKPIAVTVGEAEMVIKEADKHPNQVFSMMFNQRTNKMYKRAKEIISCGDLGEIKRADYIVTDWYRSQAYYDQGGWRASWSGEGGGALINQCVHQLDILQWLIGMPESVYAECETRGRKITVENEVTAIFRYSSGTKATFRAATNELWGTNRLEISGEKGKLIIGRARMKYVKLNKSEPEVNRDNKKGYGFTGAKTSRCGYGYIRAFRDITIGQQVRIIRDFVNAISEGKPLIAPGSEGIKALSLINAIYLSADRGKSVDLPLNNKEYDDSINIKIKEERN